MAGTDSEGGTERQRGDDLSCNMVGTYCEGDEGDIDDAPQGRQIVFNLEVAFTAQNANISLFQCTVREVPVGHAAKVLRGRNEGTGQVTLLRMRPRNGPISPACVRAC